MSAQVSADVRALFVDFGIEVDETGTPATGGLVIERFGQWDNRSSDTPVRGCICRMEVLEAA